MEQRGRNQWQPFGSPNAAKRVALALMVRRGRRVGASIELLERG
jgi:hypothetical protein